MRNGLGVFLGLLCSAAWAQTPVLDRSPATVAAAAAANLPAEAFFKNRDVLDAQLSPSGTQLALTTAAGVKRVALAVVELAPGGKAVRVAHFIDVDVVEFSWVNNNRLTTVRLKVEQIQLVSGVGHVGLGRIGLQGA
ncbi:MAG: hypothetical protein KA711_14030 [Ideonella sp. WA131b]|nr:hypothetical protein [Ideonella sp. WA131b]